MGVARLTMTRNEAYKAAKRAWRKWHHRGLRPFGHASIDAARELATMGYSTTDARMVKLWLRAFSAGRCWPDEADMLRIEREK